MREYTDEEQESQHRAERQRLLDGMLFDPPADVIGPIALQAWSSGLRGLMLPDGRLAWWDARLGSHFSGAIVLGLWKPGQSILDNEAELWPVRTDEEMETERLWWMERHTRWLALHARKRNRIFEEDSGSTPMPPGPADHLRGVVYPTANSEAALHRIYRHRSLVGCWSHLGNLAWDRWAGLQRDLSFATCSSSARSRPTMIKPA